MRSTGRRRRTGVDQDRLRRERARAEVDASDNVAQERVESHLEEAEMSAHEVSARVLEVPPRGSHLDQARRPAT